MINTTYILDWFLMLPRQIDVWVGEFLHDDMFLCFEDAPSSIYQFGAEDALQLLVNVLESHFLHVCRPLDPRPIVDFHDFNLSVKKKKKVVLQLYRTPLPTCIT
jgi:hypothetical protein